MGQLYMPKIWKQHQVLCQWRQMLQHFLTSSGALTCARGFHRRMVMSSILPYSLHEYKDLSMASATQETRVFSENCKIFSQAENLCVSCSHLSRVNSAARKRIQAQGGHIPKNCNNRFLSKTELEEKLKGEKRA